MVVQLLLLFPEELALLPCLFKLALSLLLSRSSCCLSVILLLFPLFIESLLFLVLAQLLSSLFQFLLALLLRLRLFPATSRILFLLCRTFLLEPGQLVFKELVALASLLLLLALFPELSLLALCGCSLLLLPFRLEEVAPGAI